MAADRIATGYSDLLPSLILELNESGRQCGGAGRRSAAVLHHDEQVQHRLGIGDVLDPAGSVCPLIAGVTGHHCIRERSREHVEVDLPDMARRCSGVDCGGRVAAVPAAALCVEVGTGRSGAAVLQLNVIPAVQGQAAATGCRPCCDGEGDCEP